MSPLLPVQMDHPTLLPWPVASSDTGTRCAGRMIAARCARCSRHHPHTGRGGFIAQELLYPADKG